MDNIFSNLINAMGEIWKTIGVSQKVSIILVVLLTVAGVSTVIYLGSRPDWQILESGMTRETASKVYDIARDSGCPVKLADSGTTIMVPSKEVYKLRLRVASEGIKVDKDAGDGWELFNSMSLGMTEMQQQVAKQRAQQGELQRMITKMPGIIGCRVMLTFPKRKIFKQIKEHPKASVMLSLNRGDRISNKQTNTIRYLVSSAISGMSSSDVTITDNQGNLLAKQVSSEESANGNPNGRLEIQQHIEEVLQRKAEAILRPIVGDGNVVAMVSCEMDFENIDKIVEEYNPEKSVIVSEKIITEDSSKTGKKSGGQPGFASNTQTISVENPGSPADSGKISEDKKQTAERQYLVPKTVQKTSIKGGRIKKLTVAVAVKEGTVWDEEKFTSLVSNAVGAGNYGVNPVTNKSYATVSVKQIKFQEPTPVEAWQPPMTDSIMTSVERVSDSPLVRPILGIVLLGLLFSMFKKYFNKTTIETTDIGSSVMNNAQGDLLTDNNLQQIEESNEEILNILTEKAVSSPQDLANIMENWLSKDKI